MFWLTHFRNTYMPSFLLSPCKKVPGFLTALVSSLAHCMGLSERAAGFSAFFFVPIVTVSLAKSSCSNCAPQTRQMSTSLLNSVSLRVSGHRWNRQMLCQNVRWILFQFPPKASWSVFTALISLASWSSEFIDPNLSRFPPNPLQRLKNFVTKFSCSDNETSLVPVFSVGCILWENACLGHCKGALFVLVRSSWSSGPG